MRTEKQEQVCGLCGGELGPAAATVAVGHTGERRRPVRMVTEGVWLGKLQRKGVLLLTLCSACGASVRRLEKLGGEK